MQVGEFPPPFSRVYLSGCGDSAAMTLAQTLLILLFLILAKDTIREATAGWRIVIAGIYFFNMIYSAMLICFIQIWRGIYIARFWTNGEVVFFSIPALIIPAILMGFNIRRKDDPTPKQWLLIYFILLVLLIGAQPVTILLF
jgi:hypothetical protein